MEGYSFDSLGFKDVDRDVVMMIAPEAYPLSCNNRKRNHDEDQTLVRVLIDSITYISKVDVKTGKGIAIYQWCLDFQYPKFCMLSDLAGLVELDTFSTKHRRCLIHWRFVWLHGDSSMETIKRKCYDPKVSMIFHRWHDYAWVVTLWYKSEKVSGTARVAQYILHSNFYDRYSSSGVVNYGCCLGRILTLL